MAVYITVYFIDIVCIKYVNTLSMQYLSAILGHFKSKNIKWYLVLLLY